MSEDEQMRQVKVLEIEKKMNQVEEVIKEIRSILPARGFETDNPRLVRQVEQKLHGLETHLAALKKLLRAVQTTSEEIVH